MFHKQQGNALMISIFVIVVVSAMAAAMSRVLVTTQESVSVEVVGYRAYLAANTGIEIGLQSLFPLDQAAASDCDDFPININSFNALAGLNNCQAEVACSADGVGDETIFRLESRGSCNSSAWNTSRVLEVEARTF